MTDSKTLGHDLARWLEPAHVQLDNELLEHYVAAIQQMIAEVGSHELDVARAACGALGPGAREWVSSRVQEHDATFVPEGKDALIGRLAASAAIELIRSSSSRSSALVNLAVESARFIGLDALVPELGEISGAELRATAKAVRTEVEDDDETAVGAIGKLPAERKPAADTGLVDTSELAKDLGADSKAIRALALHVDSVNRAVRRQLAATREELEILWWVTLQRDEEGNRWTEPPLAERVVDVAYELDSRTLRLPGPPSASVFMSALLGDSAQSDVGIAEIVPLISVPTPRLDDRLLPLTSAAAVAEDFPGKEELWSSVVVEKFQFEVGDRRADLVAAQLYRELQMRRLIKA